jgi:hypothetical protein
MMGLVNGKTMACSCLPEDAQQLQTFGDPTSSTLMIAKAVGCEDTRRLIHIRRLDDAETLYDS